MWSFREEVNLCGFFIIVVLLLENKLWSYDKNKPWSKWPPTYYFVIICLINDLICVQVEIWMCLMFIYIHILSYIIICIMCTKVPRYFKTYKASVRLFVSLPSVWSLTSEHEGVHIPLWLQPTSKENTKGKNPFNRF